MAKQTKSTDSRHGHAVLVLHAVKWLKKAKRCVAVLAEPTLPGCEIPDAIGWKTTGWSTVVECKVSREDFLRDKDKYFRQTPSEGLGNERWYLCPDGLIAATELPAGWGLLHFNGKRVRKVKKPNTEERNRTATMDPALKNVVGEAFLLLASLRNVQNGYTPKSILDPEAFASEKSAIKEMADAAMPLNVQVTEADTDEIGKEGLDEGNGQADYYARQRLRSRIKRLADGVSLGYQPFTAKKHFKMDQVPMETLARIAATLRVCLDAVKTSQSEQESSRVEPSV